MIGVPELDAIRSLRARSSLAEFVLIHLIPVVALTIVLWFGSTYPGREGIISTGLGVCFGSLFSLAGAPSRQLKLRGAWALLLLVLLGGGSIAALHMLLDLDPWATTALAIGLSVSALFEDRTRPGEDERQARSQRFRQWVNRELS